ncbi:MAG: hypothetical protein OEY81_02280 [Candidatus Bathyarchaeota archaeon]|nr:hypothetical protein [Candidatus Bathyarchaeota archaeon]
MVFLMLFCGSCVHVHFNLTDEDKKFLEKMLTQIRLETILDSWLCGRTARPGGHSQDPDKVRTVQILSQRIFCPIEKVWVHFLDEACYAWQPQSGVHKMAVHTPRSRA